MPRGPEVTGRRPASPEMLFDDRSSVSSHANAPAAVSRSGSLPSSPELPRSTERTRDTPSTYDRDVGGRTGSERQGGGSERRERVVRVLHTRDAAARARCQTAGSEVRACAPSYIMLYAVYGHIKMYLVHRAIMS